MTLAGKLFVKAKWILKFVGSMCFLILFISTIAMSYYGLLHDKSLNDNSFINKITLICVILAGVGNIDTFFKALFPKKQILKGKVTCYCCQNEMEIILKEQEDKD